MEKLYCRGCGLVAVEDMEKIKGDSVVFCPTCNRILKNGFTGLIK